MLALPPAASTTRGRGVPSALFPSGELDPGDCPVRPTAEPVTVVRSATRGRRAPRAPRHAVSGCGACCSSAPACRSGSPAPRPRPTGARRPPPLPRARAPGPARARVVRTDRPGVEARPGPGPEVDRIEGHAAPCPEVGGAAEPARNGGMRLEMVVGTEVLRHREVRGGRLGTLAAAFEHQHPEAPVGERQRGDDADGARADDEDVRRELPRAPPPGGRGRSPAAALMAGAGL